VLLRQESLIDGTATTKIILYLQVLFTQQIFIDFWICYPLSVNIDFSKS
jgi:hypothetical protein